MWLAGIGTWVAKKTVPAWSLALALLIGLTAGTLVTADIAIGKLVGGQDKKAAAIAIDVTKQIEAGIESAEQRADREHNADAKTAADIAKLNLLPSQDNCKIPAEFFRILNGAGK